MTLLAGAVLAACPLKLTAAPDDPPPDGFAWQELKDIRAWMLLPEGWYARPGVPGSSIFQVSPGPFTHPVFNLNGFQILEMNNTNGLSADDFAAAMIAGDVISRKVIRSWKKKDMPAGPFTSYGLVSIVQDKSTDDVRYTCEEVVIANHVTNRVYACWLCSPSTGWREIKATGEIILANLRLDPEF